MNEIFSFTGAFSDDIRFAMNSGVLPYCIMLLLFASGIIWEWKDDRPKGERFWMICGVFFIILTLLNYSALNLLSDAGCILKRTERLLKAVNLIFVYVSLGFFCRALTQHIWPRMWKYTTYGFSFFALIVYLIRLYACTIGPAINGDSMCILSLWG